MPPATLCVRWRVKPSFQASVVNGVRMIEVGLMAGYTVKITYTDPTMMMILRTTSITVRLIGTKKLTRPAKNRNTDMCRNDWMISVKYRIRWREIVGERRRRNRSRN